MFSYRLLSNFGNISNLGYFFLLIGLLLVLLPEIVKRLTSLPQKISLGL